MELIRVGDYLITYARTGNDKNGNPIYLINIFVEVNKYWINCNSSLHKKYKLDKNGNIRIQSYSIKNAIIDIVNLME